MVSKMAPSSTRSLRRELFGQPVRACEIAPGTAKTEEFSLHRFGGDREKAEAVYAGVEAPLTAEDVAHAVQLGRQPAPVGQRRPDASPASCTDLAV